MNAASHALSISPSITGACRSSGAAAKGIGGTVLPPPAPLVATVTAASPGLAAAGDGTVNSDTFPNIGAARSTSCTSFQRATWASPLENARASSHGTPSRTFASSRSSWPARLLACGSPSFLRSTIADRTALT